MRFFRQHNKYRRTTFVAVKIKLKRLGKIRNPQYRIVIADSRTARNGRSIEEIGLYHPKEEPSRIEINSERAQHWLKVGALPTEAVEVLLKITGDWQKFKDLPGKEGTLKVAAPKVDKRSIFAAAVSDAAVAKDEEAKAPKPKVEKVVKAAKAPEAVVEAPVEEVATEEAVVEAPVDAPAEAVAEEVVVEEVATEVPAQAAAEEVTETPAEA
jgi:small subunit ribosomal protein S16